MSDSDYQSKLDVVLDLVENDETYRQSHEMLVDSLAEFRRSGLGDSEVALHLLVILLDITHQGREGQTG